MRSVASTCIPCITCVRSACGYATGFSFVCSCLTVKHRMHQMILVPDVNIGMIQKQKMLHLAWLTVTQNLISISSGVAEMIVFPVRSAVFEI